MSSKKLRVKKNSLSTRDKARDMAKKADTQNLKIIDLSEVEFVSRSFADELRKKAEEFDMEIKGLNGNVEKMFSLVKRKKAPS